MSTAPALIATQAPIRQTRIHLLELGRTHPRVILAGSLVLLLFLVALLAPFISPHDPIAVNADNAYLPPLSPSHLLGTDELGRDLFSRVLWGALSLIHISEPTRLGMISYAVFCLKKKK